MSDYREAVVILVGLATAVFGWYYARRTGLQQAEDKIRSLHQDTILLLESRLATQRNQDQIRLEDLERRLSICEERWKKWSQGPVG